MSHTWTQEEAKYSFDKIIEEAVAHHEQIIELNNKQQVVVILLEDYKKNNSFDKPTKKVPTVGFAKGIFKMSDDFDEPLDDFKDYMP